MAAAPGALTATAHTEPCGAETARELVTESGPARRPGRLRRPAIYPFAGMIDRLVR
ncbi:hypothetical protein [Actinoallomurus acanthiterrae]